MSIYRFAGDWFIGLLSLLWWILIAKLAYETLGFANRLRDERATAKVALGSARQTNDHNDRGGAH
jgi:hypothetical protein